MVDICLWINHILLTHYKLQYREPGILLWRGFTVQDFANQCFGNNSGHGKGRQMPSHYGSKSLNYITISSPLTYVAIYLLVMLISSFFCY
ncbi:putative 3-methyl-2-oxobutanoate dehydrogenase (2-methylpropanoyl-transferring) [Helianthus anomalus]